MKYLILLLLANNAVAYDYTIKDKYGRVVSYANQKDNKIQEYDKFGRTTTTIEDNRVKDRYGRTKFYIEKKD